MSWPRKNLELLKMSTIKWKIVLKIKNLNY